MPTQAMHECLVKKKRSPDSKKEWAKCAKTVQKRWLVTRGCHVDYYTYPKPSKGKVKPQGSFDLRHVSMLRPARTGDPTAPEFAVEVISNRHHIVLDFELKAQHDACLMIWCSVAPPHTMPEAWKDAAHLQPSASVRDISRRLSRTMPRHDEVDRDADDDQVVAAAESGANLALLRDTPSAREEHVTKAGPFVAE